MVGCSTYGNIYIYIYLQSSLAQASCSSSLQPAVSTPLLIRALSCSLDCALTFNFAHRLAAKPGVGTYMQITMRCSKCQRDLTKGMWTAAQWSEQRSDVGGRDECRECWQRGPTSTDWMEVDRMVLLVDALSLKNVSLVYQDFMTSFLCSMTSEERKIWSYKGYLPVRVPTDYKTHPR